MIKNIVFDWDGTLVNTLPFLEETFQKTFEYLGIPVLSPKEIRELAHNNPECNILKLAFGEENSLKASQFFNDYTKRHHLRQLQQFSHSLEVLDFCQANNINCYVFSTKKNEFLHREMDSLGWSKYFRKASGAVDASTAKPSTKACLEFFSDQLPPLEELLVVGDGPTDVQVARVWGCKVVIIDTPDKYSGGAPDYKLKSLKEFIPLLQSMLY